MMTSNEIIEKVKLALADCDHENYYDDIIADALSELFGEENWELGEEDILSDWTDDGKRQHSCVAVTVSIYGVEYILTVIQYRSMIFWSDYEPTHFQLESIVLVDDFFDNICSFKFKEETIIIGNTKKIKKAAKIKNVDGNFNSVEFAINHILKNKGL